MDNKVLMMESRMLFIEASTPEPDENSQVLNQIEFTRALAEVRNESLIIANVGVELCDCRDEFAGRCCEGLNQIQIPKQASEPLQFFLHVAVPEQVFHTLQLS